MLSRPSNATYARLAAAISTAHWGTSCSADGNKPLLRPYLARLCYEAAGGTDWVARAPVFATTELLNISTYQINLCFDEKIGDGGTTPTAQFIASMLTFSAAIETSAATDVLGPSERSTAAQLLASTNAAVYLGQFLDTSVLTLSAFEPTYRNDPSGFLEIYLQRCKLIGASTFEVCAVGALAAPSAPGGLSAALTTFLFGLGIAGQVLNDLADLIPTDARSYTKAYADARMGRLTWPIYILASETGLPQEAWAARLNGREIDRFFRP